MLNTPVIRDALAILVAAAFAFILSKTWGLIDWSWSWVLSPVAGMGVLILGAAALPVVLWAIRKLRGR